MRCLIYLFTILLISNGLTHINIYAAENISGSVSDAVADGGWVESKNANTSSGCPTYDEVLYSCQNQHSCARGGSGVLDIACNEVVNACVKEWEPILIRCAGQNIPTPTTGFGEGGGPEVLIDDPAATPETQPQVAAEDKPEVGDPAKEEKKEQDDEPSKTANNIGYSQEDLEREVSKCNESSRIAYKCCNAPEQCGASSGSSNYMIPPTNDPEGMKRYCEQMKYASLSGRQGNAEAAGICFTNHTSCSGQCENSKNKWEAHLPNCKMPNCDASKVRQAISIFNLKVSECNGLKENERLLASQSTSNYTDARASQLCAQESALNPSSLMPQKSEKPEIASTGPDCSGENASKPECIDCSMYPNSPACGAGNQPNPYDNSQAGPIKKTSDDGISMGDFNPNSPADGLPQFPTLEPTAPEAVQNAGIPNGGAGGVPGMGTASAGGSGFEGTEGGGGTGGYETDVLEGQRGGSGYSSDPSAIGGSGGGFSGYGRGGSEKFKSKYRGLDLKQYLPGGKKDPKRNVASATSTGTGHPDIAPMGVSMFKKISDRFSLMCKMKQLIGCE